MSDTRLKLLQLIQKLDHSTLSDEMIVDLLQVQVKRLEDERDKANAKGLQREEMLDHREEQLRRDADELRRNPATIINGPFYFDDGDGNKFEVRILRGVVECINRRGLRGTLYTMQPITPREWGEENSMMRRR